MFHSCSVGHQRAIGQQPLSVTTELGRLQIQAVGGSEDLYAINCHKTSSKHDNGRSFPQGLSKSLSASGF